MSVQCRKKNDRVANLHYTWTLFLPFLSPSGRVAGHHLSPPHLPSFLQGAPKVQYREIIYQFQHASQRWPISSVKTSRFSVTTLALRSLSAGVSVQMERSFFSGPDLFLKVRAPKPMCCSSGGSSVIHVSLVSTSGVSCLQRNKKKNRHESRQQVKETSKDMYKMNSSRYFTVIVLYYCIFSLLKGMH